MTYEFSTPVLWPGGPSVALQTQENGFLRISVNMTKDTPGAVCDVDPDTARAVIRRLHEWAFPAPSIGIPSESVTSGDVIDAYMAPLVDATVKHHTRHQEAVANALRLLPDADTATRTTPTGETLQAVPEPRTAFAFTAEPSTPRRDYWNIELAGQVVEFNVYGTDEDDAMARFARTLRDLISKDG